MYRPDFVEKFWSRVDKSSECWLWTAARTKAGYGNVWLNGRNEVAHRVAFLLTYGRWPEPFCLHVCDNPPCVNPAHLFEGTLSDNTRDMVQKGRHVGNTQLTNAQVIEIRNCGDVQRVVAERFGISQTHVSAIRLGRKRNGASAAVAA